MSPTLSQVLASGGRPLSFNVMYFATALIAFCAAVFSVTKGYELFRRRGTPIVVEKAPNLSEVGNNEKLEKFSFLVNELKHENNQLADRNLDMQNQLRGWETQKQVENVLRRSNVILAKECEKLKTEKEAWMLKMAEPLLKAKRQSKVIKKGARKPKRVSRKK